MTREQLIRGEGQFIADLPDADCRWVAFVRSPHAHARVLSVLPPEGARDVTLVTGRDLAGSIQPLRVQAPGLNVYDWHPMHPERALFVGDPVAAVVADSPYEAEDLADAVRVEYEPLPAVTSLEAAAGNETTIHPDLSDNVLFKFALNEGAATEAFASADLVVERTFRYPRQTAVPLECRGALARYDPREQRFTLWTSTQVPHYLRNGLSQILGVPEDAIRVIRPDVGGAFGLKAQLFPEEVILPWLARETGGALKWVEDRRENLLASVHAHEGTLTLGAAFDGDGNLRAARARAEGDAGAHSVFPFGAGLDPFTTVINLFGAYRHEIAEIDATGYATNKAPAGSYRGVGQVLAVFAVERLLDIAAGELGLDPAEIRRRNLLRTDDFPHTTPTGNAFDTGNYQETLRMALARADYDGLRAEQRTATTAGKRLGVGVGTFNEVTGVTLYPGYDGARVRIAPDGTIQGFMSSASSGQGHAEVYGRLIAEELGVPRERVQIVEGDTDLCPPGSGTYASRTAVTMGNTLTLASQDLRRKLLKVAALMLKFEGELSDARVERELTIADGRICLAEDPATGVDFDEVVQAAYLQTLDFALPQEIVEAGLEVTRYEKLPQNVFSNTAIVAAVDVDTETGHFEIRRLVMVGDCGRILDRETVDGQAIGGAAMGIGCGTLERLAYDAAGQLLTASLMDYLVPTAMEVPPIEVGHLETPSSVTRNAAKGMGESGTMGIPAVLANAVADALGAEVTELPLSEERIAGLAMGASSH